MFEQSELNPADRELEASLKSLTPKAAHIDPVAAAYCAGQRSARREIRRWRIAAAVIALVGAGSWVVPVGQRSMGGNHAADIVVHPPEIRALPEQSMINLQRVVWEKGVDGLAPVQPAPTKGIRFDEVISTQKGKS
jgi:hypothetical protein